MRLEMTFKTPDPYSVNIDTGAEFEGITELPEPAKSLVNDYVEHMEYIHVLFDTEDRTVRVLKVGGE